jgi:NAD(P)-dependent dehydrogenase (short-subunit alcohol dehydrogenase family)
VELNLMGKVAVVTGASKGIGLAITRALAEEGALVVAASLHGSPELDLLAERWHVHPILVDLSTDTGPAAVIAEAIDHYEHLDVLVNNVGAVRPRPDGFLSITDEDWSSTFTINFFAAVRTMRAALPHLAQRSKSSIVTISSVNAFLPDPLVVDYCAAKGALANLSKALSKEYGPRGVRVNTVSPGPVETDLWLGEHGVAATVARAQGSQPADVEAGAASQSVTGRFTQPHEVADLVLLLASDRTSNVTGADFVIDGGLVTTL